MPRGKGTKSLFLVYNLLTTELQKVFYLPLESAALPSGHEPLYVQSYLRYAIGIFDTSFMIIIFNTKMQDDTHSISL